MTAYNSSAVCEAVRAEYSKPEHKPVIAAIDDYANTERGYMATENLMGSGDKDDRKTFKRGAAKYVRKEVYGGIGGMLIWMLVKPWVMAIIEKFIESMLMEPQ